MPFHSSKPFSTASSSSSSSLNFTAAGVSLVPCELLVASVRMRVFVSFRNGNSGSLTARSAGQLVRRWELPFSAGVILEERPEMLRRLDKFGLVTHSKEHTEECACHLSGKQCQICLVMDCSPCSATSETPAKANGTNRQTRCEKVGTPHALTPMTNDVRLSVADDTGSDQSSTKLSAKDCSENERPGGPGAFQKSNSTMFLFRGLSGKCPK